MLPFHKRSSSAPLLFQSTTILAPKGHTHSILPLSNNIDQCMRKPKSKPDSQLMDINMVEGKFNIPHSPSLTRQRLTVIRNLSPGTEIMSKIKYLMEVQIDRYTDYIFPFRSVDVETQSQHRISIILLYCIRINSPQFRTRIPRCIY